jgi:hypothetical protein
MTEVFHVRSGEYEADVRAEDAIEAAEQAVRLAPVGTMLGIMLSVQGRGEPWYFATRPLLSAALN